MSTAPTTVSSTVPGGQADPAQVPGPSALTLVMVELRKATDTLTGRWLLTVTAALVVGALALAVGFSDRSEWSLQLFLTWAALPLSLLLPVLGVLLVSGEFSQRTVLTTFALAPSRSRFVLTKTAAAVVLAVLGSLVTAVLAVAATGLATARSTDTSWSLEPAVALQLLAAQVVFVLVGVGFGLLAQNTPLAVVAYLLLPSILSPVLLIVPSLADVGSWVDLGTASFPLLAPAVMDAGQWARVGTTTALWAGLPFALGWLRLLRREIA